MSSSPLTNTQRLELLTELVSPRTGFLSTMEFREQWDEVARFDSAIESEISQLLSVLQGIIKEESESSNLREISSVMRGLAGQIKFASATQIDIWLELSQTLISLCNTKHDWRYENGAEWYHDAINSVCGNATHSALIPILLNPELTMESTKSKFKDGFGPITQNHIEELKTSHSESIVAALARNAIWIDQSLPGWLEEFIYPLLSDFERESTRAFWQGFLVNRKWDLNFLSTSSIDTRLLQLLDRLNFSRKNYLDYFGRDSSESFIFLLVEFFLRTPKDKQLTEFFSEFIRLELNTRLFVRWLEATAWSLHKINYEEYPNLADEIFVDRFQPLMERLEILSLSPETVGAIAESLGAFRKYFPDSLTTFKDLIEKYSYKFSQDSRILMWLTNQENGSYLVENWPRELCEFIEIYLSGLSRNESISDWELSEFIANFGETLLTTTPTEMNNLLTTCRAKGLIRTTKMWPSLPGDN